MPKLIELALSSTAQESASLQSFRVGIRNATTSEPAEIVVYGEIGSEWDQADARSIGQFLRANKGKAVNVRINSGGGGVFDGITIHNSLVQHDGRVVCIVEGIAGSAATIVALGGHTVAMFENASFFVHRASVVAVGNIDMMQEAAEWLAKIDDAIAKTYKAKTGKPMDKIVAWMRGKVDGTVFTAKEALENKFIDKIIDLKQPKSVMTAQRAEGDARLKSVTESRLERMRLRGVEFKPAE